MWQIALFLVGFPVVLVVISFSILKLIEKHKGEKLKKWAEENGLRYVGRVASSVHLLEGRIQDIIWGTYKGKRIFIFKFSGVEKASILSNAELYKYTRSDIIIVGYLFINGYFYKPGFGYHIDKEKIDSLINNESVKKIEQVGVSEFGNDKIWEHIMFVIAHLFFEQGIEVSYRDCKRTIFSANKFFQQKKIGLLNSLYSLFLWKTYYTINEEVNKQEVVSFVKLNNTDLNQKTIQNVLNEYHKLRTEWRNSGALM